MYKGRGTTMESDKNHVAKIRKQEKILIITCFVVGTIMLLSFLRRLF